MQEKQVKKNQSIERIFSIIEVMAENGGDMKLQDIAAKTKLPPGTALRLLYTLMTLGYATQNESTQQYSLTLKFTYIGRQVESKFDLRHVVKPYLEEISKITGEASCLSIEDNNELLYIDSVDGEDSLLKVTQKIGKKAPLYCTAAGKLYLTEKTDDEFERLCPAESLIKLTEHTIVNKKELINCVQQAKKNDFAVDDEECELGVRCVAVPLRKFNSEIVATISVTGPIFRMKPEKIETIKTVLLQERDKMEHVFSRTKKS